MSFTIKIVTNKRELNRFVQFPLSLYKKNRFYVPPLLSEEKNRLSSKKNPAFDFSEASYWLAYKDGMLAGRIAGIINHRYNEELNCKRARFSWFDMINDQEVCNLLLHTVEKWAKEKGMEVMLGPYGFSNLDKHGLLIEGYEELATASSNYNFPYYKTLLENAGYQKKIDWVEYRVNVPEAIPEKMVRVSKWAIERYKLKIFHANSTKELLRFKNDMFILLNRAYSDLYGFTSLTEKQMDAVVKNIFSYLNPKYLSFVLDEDDRIVAFGISVPSVSKALQKAKGKMLPFGFFHLWKALRTNDTIDLLLIAVRPEFQDRGVNAILFYDLIPICIKNNIKFVETTQNQVTNKKVQAQWAYFDRRLHKRSRLYIKDL
ncbi:MAG: N-acetyltransferase [Bacteroidales bacterium]|nr:N-acetyltransferase [Bacteroidales bacterium]